MSNLIKPVSREEERPSGMVTLNFASLVSDDAPSVTPTAFISEDTSAKKTWQTT